MNIPKQWKWIALYTVIVYLLFVAAIEYAKRDEIGGDAMRNSLESKDF